MEFIVFIAAIVILFFVKKDDDTVTILKKIALGIILAITLLALWLFVVVRLFSSIG